MPVSDKRKLVIASIAAAACIYAGLATVLGRAAVWAESGFDAYPFHGGEETIHFLLPSIFRADTPRILIIGPSAVGEDLLYEVMSTRLSGRVISAGMSNGTIDDVAIGLEYIERAHGPAALPEQVVLGITSKVIANYPRSFGPNKDPDAFAPLISMINKYSPEFSVRPGPLGSALVEKSPAEKAEALRNWVGKQQLRYRTGLLASIENLQDPTAVKVGYQNSLPYFDDLRRPFSGADVVNSLAYIGKVGLAEAAGNWLPAYRSAYYSMFMQPVAFETVAANTDSWNAIYAWDPRSEEDMVRYQLSRLHEFMQRHSIELTVVYLPEHPASRHHYNPVYYASYRNLIEEMLPNAQIVDLWDRLPESHFYDMIHTNYQGSREATNAVLDAIQTQPASRADSPDPSAAKAKQR